MAPRRPPPRAASRTKPTAPTPRAVDADRVTLRGLDAKDIAALDAYTAKRREELRDLGATISRNTVACALVRDALRRAGAYDLLASSDAP